MPGNYGLQPGIERVHDLAEVEVREHPGSFFETLCACNRVRWQDGVAGKLSVIGTLGLSCGCSRISGTEPGVIRWCDVYYPRGNKRVREHELQHCRGYADLF